MSIDKIKTSRASQSRAKTAKKTTWTPPSSLDAPPAPDGYGLKEWALTIQRTCQVK